MLSKATFALTGNSRQRLRLFLSHPSDNSRFYGLYRIENARKAYNEIIPGFYAADWLFVASIAISGTILQVPDVLMIRQRVESTGYFIKWTSKNPLFICFPLLPFTIHLLKHTEAWSICTLKHLIRLNTIYHVSMAQHSKWFVYPVYKVIYRAILKPFNVSKKEPEVQ
jgi:hypothetical protein